MSLSRILSDAEEEVLSRERRALAECRLALERGAIDETDPAALDASVQQLDELFLLVVAGEFNAGKSAFVNALLGRGLLEEGVTPTTQRITLVKHGERQRRERRADGVEVLEAPLSVLRRVDIVDTPGTNAITREHEALTRDFIPRSDPTMSVSPRRGRRS